MIQSQDHFRVTVLAALLHDIGKFLQRGSDVVQGRHPETSATLIRAHRSFFARYVDPEELATLVERHHESSLFPEHLQAQKAPADLRQYCLLVSRADNYSSSERDEQRQRNYRTVPLVSVFSRLRLANTSSIPVQSYAPMALSPQAGFPRSDIQLKPFEIDRLLKEFDVAFTRLTETPPSDFDMLIAHLLNILESYCWAIPANTQEEHPDVSLYDHLRTTCGIAAALYEYHRDHGDLALQSVTDDEALKFRLIVGDLSGIQRYIFDIASAGAGGVAKRLRSRSFFVGAVTTAAAQMLIKRLGLTQANILMQSGGKFYVLAANTDKTDVVLTNCQHQINEDLLKRYGGEMSLNLASITMSGKDFANYAGVTRRLGEKLAQAKQMPYRQLLQPANGWAEDRFVVPFPPVSGRGYCRACGKLPASSRHKDTEICWLCERDLQLGSWLPKANYLAYYDSKPERDREVIELPGSLWVTVTPALPQSPQPLVVYALQGAGRQMVSTVPIRTLYSASYTPINPDGSVQDFEEIAARAHGKELLGYVKADVDNLGALFALGMGQAGTVSRVATLSRMLDLFFSGWVRERIVRDFPDMYVVYAGGDDLLAIGPWDQSISMIKTIRDDFARFAADNPDVTLSASLTLAKPSHPVAQVVDTAEEHLDAAKDQPAKHHERGRDQLYLLGDLLKWGDLEPVIKDAEQVAGWLEQRELGVSSAFVHRLLHYADLFDRYLEGQADGLRYLPLLTYDLARNFPSPRQQVVRQWAEGLKDINGGQMDHLAVIARYALLRRRGSSA